MHRIKSQVTTSNSNIVEPETSIKMFPNRPATSMGNQRNTGLQQKRGRSIQQFSFFGDVSRGTIAKSLPIHGARPVSAVPSIRRRGHRALQRSGSYARSKPVTASIAVYSETSKQTASSVSTQEEQVLRGSDSSSCL